MSLYGGKAAPTATEATGQSPRWSRRLRKIMATGWASFLTACVASLMFFAVFDPARIGEAADWPLELSRMGGYALLFFFFWLIGMGAASTTLVLMRGALRSRREATDKD